MKKRNKITVSSSWFMKFMAAFFTAVFVVTLIPALQGSEGATVGIFIGAGPMTILGWSLALYRVQVSEESVTVRTILGHYRIKWDDVEMMLSDGTRVALVGKNKRLVLKFDSLGSKVKKLIEVFNQEIAERQIPAENNVDFPSSQLNSKVQR